MKPGSECLACLRLGQFEPLLIDLRVVACGSVGVGRRRSDKAFGSWVQPDFLASLEASR